MSASWLPPSRAQASIRWGRYATTKPGAPSLKYLARTLVDGRPQVVELVDELVTDAVEYMADGTLELDAHPIARWRVVGERLGVLAISVLVLTTVTASVIQVLVAALDMDVAASAMLATSTGMLLLVLGLGLVAFGVGAAAGRRAVAQGVAAALAVFAYVANAMGALVDWGAWLKAVSPFSWYLGPDPLVTGWHLGSLLGLAAISAVFAAVALVTFDRRDLGV